MAINPNTNRSIRDLLNLLLESETASAAVAGAAMHTRMPAVRESILAIVPRGKAGHHTSDGQWVDPLPHGHMCPVATENIRQALADLAAEAG